MKKQFNLRKPFLKRLPILLLGYLFFICGTVMCGTIVGLAVERRIAHGADSTDLFVIPFFLFFCVVFAFGLMLNMSRDLIKVTLSESGIQVHKHKRLKADIPWTEIEEIGIALQPKKGDPDRNLYFSTWQLSKFRKTHIEDPDIRGLFSNCFDKSGIVWVKLTELVNIELLERFCPMPIPSLDAGGKDIFVLESYKRNRNSDGTWSDAEHEVFYSEEYIKEYNEALMEERRKRFSDKRPDPIDIHPPRQVGTVPEESFGNSFGQQKQTMNDNPLEK